MSKNKRETKTIDSRFKGLEKEGEGIESIIVYHSRNRSQIYQMGSLWTRVSSRRYLDNFTTAGFLTFLIDKQGY